MGNGDYWIISIELLIDITIEIYQSWYISEVILVNYFVLQSPGFFLGDIIAYKFRTMKTKD